MKKEEGATAGFVSAVPPFRFGALEIDVGWYKIYQYSSDLSTNSYCGAVYVLGGSGTYYEHWYLDLGTYLEPSSTNTTVSHKFVRQADNTWNPNTFDGADTAKNVYPTFKYLLATCVDQ